MASIQNTQPTFTYGYGSLPATTSAFIEGSVEFALSVDGSKNAYVAGGGTYFSHNAFISAAPTVTGIKRAYVLGEIQGGPTAMRFTTSDVRSVTIPHSYQHEGLEAFTFNIWVRYRENDPAGPIVTKGDDFTISWTGNAFRVKTKVNSTSYEYGTLTCEINKWYMLSITKYPYTSEVGFYLNGDLKLVYTDVNGNWNVGTQPWVVGGASNVDVSMMQIWNENLGETGVSEFYTHPYIRDCQAAHVTCGEPLPASGLKRCVIYSDISQTNPAWMLASQRCLIPADGIESGRDCYIVAGNENHHEFDMLIEEDPYSHQQFDIALIPVAPPDIMGQVVTGKVDYPITRIVVIPVTVVSDGRPFVIETVDTVGSMSVWINTYNTVSVPTFDEGGDENALKMCYIPVNTAIGDTQHCCIVGATGFDPVDTPCYIVHNGMSSTVESFIDGFEYDNIRPEELLIYIKGDWDNAVGSQPAYIFSVFEGEAFQSAYIEATSRRVGEIFAYVTSIPLNTCDGGIAAYIKAVGDTSDSNPAYILGAGGIVGSQNSYICAQPIADSSQDAFLLAWDTKLAPRKDAFIKADTQLVSNKMMFLFAELNEEDSQPCYIAGINGNIWIHHAYLVGPTTTPLVDSQSAYLNGSGLSTSLNGFIVSDLVEPLPCYILSVGSTTREQGVVIVA